MTDDPDAGTGTPDRPAEIAGDPDTAGPPDRPAGEHPPATDAPADAPAAFDAADVAGATEVPVPRDRPPDATVSSAGLVLHWKLDEPSGTTARDSSPSGFNGAYTGEPPPAHEPVGAAPIPDNGGSRRFGAFDQSVWLSDSLPALRPTAGLTVSLWFRTRQSARAELVCNGRDYYIQIASPAIEFTRRGPSGGPATTTASGSAPAAFDGAWHHVAGVATMAGTTVYLDGDPIGRAGPAALTYLSGSVNVARSSAASLNFVGSIDDVRIYARALDDAEIKALAAGAP